MIDFSSVRITTFFFPLFKLLLFTLLVMKRFSEIREPDVAAALWEMLLEAIVTMSCWLAGSGDFGYDPYKWIN